MKILLQKPTLKPINSTKQSNAIFKFKTNTKITQRKTKVHSSPIPTPDDFKKNFAEAMEDPKVKARIDEMSELLKDPDVQKQLQQTMSLIQNKEMVEKIQKLREDPELIEKFKELETGGMSAFMKLYNDPDFLRKIGEKMSSLPAELNPTGSDLKPTESRLPQINNLIDAAKYGDLEAVEDFLAIGKDPNMVDEHNRTSLHFAASIENMDVMDALIGAGANVQLRDSKGNSALHYATGYGCVNAVKRLLDAGIDGSFLNASGNAAADLAKLSNENPVFKDAVLLRKLEEAKKIGILNQN